jgi:hypothetical protein
VHEITSEITYLRFMSSAVNAGCACLVKYREIDCLEIFVVQEAVSAP